MDTAVSRRGIVALAGSAAIGLMGLTGCEAGSPIADAGMQGKTLYAKLVTKQAVFGEITSNDVGDIVTITFNSDTTWHLSGNTEWTGTYFMEGEDIVMSVDTYGYTQTLEKVEDGSYYSERGHEGYWLHWYEDEADAEGFYDVQVAYIPEFLKEELDGTKWSADYGDITVTFSGDQLEWSVTEEGKNKLRIPKPDDNWPYEDHSGEYELSFEMRTYDNHYIGQMTCAEKTFDYEFVYRDSIEIYRLCGKYDFVQIE